MFCVGFLRKNYALCPQDSCSSVGLSPCLGNWEPFRAVRQKAGCELNQIEKKPLSERKTQGKNLPLLGGGQTGQVPGYALWQLQFVEIEISICAGHKEIQSLMDALSFGCPLVMNTQNPYHITTLTSRALAFRFLKTANVSNVAIDVEPSRLGM